MIGETIKDFKITSLLGRGGMGEVYVGTQQIVHTRVAIKLLREDISTDRQHVQRFFNEAITAAGSAGRSATELLDQNWLVGSCDATRDLPSVRKESGRAWRHRPN